jgi:hypothetical protein
VNSSLFYIGVWVPKPDIGCINCLEVQLNSCPYSVNPLVWMKTQPIMITLTLEVAPTNFGMES